MKTTQNSNSGTILSTFSLTVPDFEKSLCLVIRDRAGNELFRSAPSFSLVEGERIGEHGIDEYLEIALVPDRDGVRPTGMVWNDQRFCWDPAKAPVDQSQAVEAR
jgi:hypothetical protein